MSAPFIPPSHLNASAIARVGGALIADTADARLNPAGKLVVRQKQLMRSSAIRAISAYLEDRTGVAGYDMFNRTLEVAALVRKGNKILAIAGAISAPVTAASTADEDRVLAFNERLRALEGDGIYYVDRWAAVSDGGRPANIKYPDYASTPNQLHWTTAGAAREGDYAYTPVLQAIADAWFAV